MADFDLTNRGVLAEPSVPETSIEFILEWFNKAAQTAFQQGNGDSAQLWKDGLQHLKYYDAAVSSQRAEIAGLRAGNTLLLDALMGMVDQFFYESDGVLSHAFMSAEEQAIDVLMQAGMAEEEEPGKNAYRLKWDALEARKPKQMSWAEAVEETITDPDEKARLLAMDDAALTKPEQE